VKKNKFREERREFKKECPEYLQKRKSEKGCPKK
jgi:hypothetical protein